MWGVIVGSAFDDYDLEDWGTMEMSGDVEWKSKRCKGYKLECSVTRMWAHARRRAAW